MLSGFNNDDENNENTDKEKMIKYAIDGQVSYKTINNVVYFYSPLKYKDDIFAILELKYSVVDRVSFFNNIKKMFYGTGFFALLCGITLGVIYFSKFTKDIYKLRNYVNSIQKGEFKEFKKLKRKDELGELCEGFIGMSSTIEKNINDLKVERDSLSMAVNKLKKMDKEQKEFIGSVTHEFKTPITTIKAYGDLISMYPDDLDLIDDGTHKISKECDRLAGLVENVLRLSALEKYDFEIEKKEVNLSESVTEICERLKGRIIRNNLKLKYDFEDIVINMDEESLKHIVINIGSALVSILVITGVYYCTKTYSQKINVVSYKEPAQINESGYQITKYENLDAYDWIDDDNVLVLKNNDSYNDEDSLNSITCMSIYNLDTKTYKDFDNMNMGGNSYYGVSPSGRYVLYGEPRYIPEVGSDEWKKACDSQELFHEKHDIIDLTTGYIIEDFDKVINNCSADYRWISDDKIFVNYGGEWGILNKYGKSLKRGYFNFDNCYSSYVQITGIDDIKDLGDDCDGKFYYTKDFMGSDRNVGINIYSMDINSLKEEFIYKCEDSFESDKKGKNIVMECCFNNGQANEDGVYLMEILRKLEKYLI